MNCHRQACLLYTIAYHQKHLLGHLQVYILIVYIYMPIIFFVYLLNKESFCNFISYTILQYFINKLSNTHCLFRSIPQYKQTHRNTFYYNITFYSILKYIMLNI